MKFLRHFLYVVLAALGSSVLGALFGVGIAFISPDFVRGLFGTSESTDLIRYAAAVGMIWGLFLGTGVMGFTLALSTLVLSVRILRGQPVDSGK
jgi:hypothetical protein